MTGYKVNLHGFSCLFYLSSYYPLSSLPPSSFIDTDLMVTYKVNPVCTSFRDEYLCDTAKLSTALLCIVMSCYEIQSCTMSTGLRCPALTGHTNSNNLVSVYHLSMIENRKVMYAGYVMFV